MINKLSPFTILYRLRAEEDDEAFGPASFYKPGYWGGGGGGGGSEAQSRAVAPKKGSAKKGARKAAKASAGRKRASKKRAAGGASAAATSDKLRSQLRAIGSPPEVTEPLASLNPKLSHTLLDNSLAQAEAGEDWAAAAVERLRPVVEDLERGDTTVTVAVWDMDARVGLLPEIVELLNRAQEVFTFFDLQAPMPAGLVVRTEHFEEWVKQRAGKSLKNFKAWVRDSTEKKRVTAQERRQFNDNIMSDDFYKYARIVRKELGVDYLAGITQFKVAGYEKGDYFWDYFSASHKNVLLASAFDLREYAHEAGRHFEVAVAQVVLAQLLVEMGPKVLFHEDRGCIFDFNESRSSIVRSLREMRVEPECLAKIREPYRGAVEKLVGALRDYSRPAEFVQAAQAEQAEIKKKSAKHDDEYWLKKLDLLSEKLGKGQKS